METSDDEFVSEEEAEAGPAALKKLREKLKRAVDEKQEYLEGWQRARADFANYKKEEASINADKEASMLARAVEELLPALDALELALKHHDDKTLRMLEKQFLDSLKRLGVERFGATGEDFDPHKHEALAMKGKEHMITSVERSGYAIGTKIIRPAQVIL